MRLQPANGAESKPLSKEAQELGKKVQEKQKSVAETAEIEMRARAEGMIEGRRICGSKQDKETGGWVVSKPDKEEAQPRGMHQRLPRRSGERDADGRQGGPGEGHEHRGGCEVFAQLPAG